MKSNLVTYWWTKNCYFSWCSRRVFHGDKTGGVINSCCSTTELTTCCHPVWQGLEQLLAVILCGKYLSVIPPASHSEHSGEPLIMQGMQNISFWSATTNLFFIGWIEHLIWMIQPVPGQPSIVASDVKIFGLPLWSLATQGVGYSVNIPGLPLWSLVTRRMEVFKNTGQSQATSK